MTTRGFTLLEVLVAIVIVGLVSVSTLAAVGAAVRVSDRATTAIVAAELAEERLASLLTLSPAILADSADSVERNMRGMSGWRWIAETSSREDGLLMLTVRVLGENEQAERVVLRPRGYP